MSAEYRFAGALAVVSVTVMVLAAPVGAAAPPVSVLPSLYVRGTNYEVGDRPREEMDKRKKIAGR